MLNLNDRESGVLKILAAALRLALALTPILVIFSHFTLARADPLTVNITIDDHYGDALTGIVPTYNNGPWWQGVNCSLCEAQPNVSLVMDGTWHDSTWYTGDGEPNSIEMTFNGECIRFSLRLSSYFKHVSLSTGSAIYVYCILADQPWSLAGTNMSFTLDGEVVGFFTHIPDSNAKGYEYNQLVYSNSSLSVSPSAEHQLTISSAGVSLILFDYALRT